MPRCLLIDGNNIVFRAFYAFQRQRLKTRDGKPTGAIFGFTRMLLKMISERKPDLIAVAFDTTRDTFRRKLYPEYKAKRKPVPEELLEQIPVTHKIVETLGITLLKSSDYEADDLIGSVSKQLKNAYDIEIVTGDRDLLQLIDDGKVTVELCRKGISETQLVDAQAFIAEYGFEPENIVELKALMGDSSDNIPGVKGIGEKKGMALIQEFNTIDKLYENLDKVTNVKMREKLAEGKDMAYLSQDLATIRCDLTCIESPDDLAWQESALESPDFLQLLSELEFVSLYREYTGKELKLPEKKEAINQVKLEGERLLVNKTEELEKFFAQEVKDCICLDIETSGFNPFQDKIIGISFAAGTKKAIYVPIAHSYLGLSENDQLSIEKLKPVLNKQLSEPLIIGHNLKFDLAFLREAGIETGQNLFDTLIAAYVIDPTRSNALKNLGKDIFNFQVSDYKEVAKNKNFAEVNLADATEYACQDTLLTWHFYEYFQKQLKEKGLTELFENLEIPLVKILLEMEQTGIKLNEKYLANLSEELSSRLEELEASIHEHAGKIFNINSTKQLQEVLFSELGLTPPKKTKTGYSTDSEVLKRLASAHPICQKLIEYRELTKLKTTYADSLTKLVNHKTHLIHASFNQAVTATGRLSSSNPNMQNIPIKTEWGRKIRRAFEPPINKHKFLSIDYSQIELRLLAHFSQDPDLVKAYDENIDIHAMTAAKIFNKPVENVDSAERNIGKTVNFGIIYGISAHGLAEDLAISRPQAKEYIDSFYNNFSKVTGFFESVVEEAKQTHEVSTLLGRTRHLPDIDSKRFQIRSQAERVAKNTRLQGSAADLVKKAMIDTTKLIAEKGLSTKLILQIHDELVFSVPESELSKIAPMLKECMENCVKLNVPLVCDMTVGNNLADLEETT
jgi:DNA polymerase-1